ncbi:MAG TPA: YdiU family protein [Rhodopila sp.]|uniref:protein adenylyltransferase SelO n=1 Tax=Rhodopila sp. TaxID=2480087 RepID=UPI002CCCA57D|nr:YdiU family protein [Rhodopila sp.]HVY16786.1 YdiU family protein [Rhodopila sp.]
MRIDFDNSYARLPDRFYARQDPVPVAAPRLIKLNVALAEELGLDPVALASPEGVAMLAGNRVVDGSTPIALAYAGHQFGQFVPQLGDGRANLLGEVIGRDGVRRDIQLKGSGQTRFSRGGDGRAAVGPVLREYIVSEAMAALGVPTTRSLAAVATGEPVYREQILPGAVLTRVASSHVRVGTFQYFAARGDIDGLRLLAKHVIDRHYPQAGSIEALLDAIVDRQARLVAQWLAIGFVHGVMNTDNCSIAGETIDYGPCAFMEAYDAATVFSSIDHYGRYAYGNQPRIVLWNLSRLAETLLPLINEDQEKALPVAEAVLSRFGPRFEDAYHAGLRAKLGLAEERDGDTDLAQDFLKLLAEHGVDFTQGFRGLCAAAEGGQGGDTAMRAMFGDGAGFDAWVARWRRRRAEGGAMDPAAMRRVNPIYIPRNHLVEAAIKAGEAGDFVPFETLVSVLANPFDERSGLEAFSRPAEEHERVRVTFCGT